MKRSTWIFLVAIIALLPIMIFRDYTPDNELRYLSIADEALRNGTFFTFSHQGVPYADKPPLYLWIVMACRLLFGCSPMVVLSMFSLVPALVIAGVMNSMVGKGYNSDSIKELSTVMLLSCGLFLGTAIVVRMDMLMCMFIVLAVKSFWNMYTSRRFSGRDTWLFPIYLFLALFTKGPLGLIIPMAGVAVFLLSVRRPKMLCKCFGLKTWAVLLLLSGVWFAAVYFEGGHDYLNNLLFHQTVDRAVSAFHHQRPFWHYAVSLWYCMQPWAFLLVGVTVVAVCERTVKSDVQRLFLSIAVTTFVVLSCVSSKLDVYMIPAYPFLVYYAVSNLSAFNDNKWVRLSVAVPSVIFAVSPIAVWFMSDYQLLGNFSPVLLYAASSLLCLTGIAVLSALYRRRDVGSAVFFMGGGLALTVFLCGWFVGGLNPYLGYGDVCKLAAQSGHSVLVDKNISEAADMDVYLGKRMSLVDADSVSRNVHGKDFVLITDTANISKFPNRTAERCGRLCVIR